MEEGKTAAVIQPKASEEEEMTELRPGRILAVETSCDETACAILENVRMLLGSAVASQMELHARYGGVYPEVASRQHVLSIVPVIEERARHL